MLKGLNTALAVLLITWGAPLVGVIPVLIGRERFRSERNGTSQRTSSRALRVLTISICIGPIGSVAFRILDSLVARPLGLIHPVSLHIWIGILVAAFVLALAALSMAWRERNVARISAITGALAVVLVNAAGFIWLLILNGPSLPS